MLADNLEYLMCSLPNLSFGNSKELQQNVKSILKQYALTTENTDNLTDILDAEAEKFLSHNYYSLFKNINLHNIYEIKFANSTHSLLSGFSKYVFSLKQEIKKIRIARIQNKSNSQSKDAISLKISGSPLDQEIQLMELQWQKLEELSAGHYTDFDALIGYKLKLLLLTRWWSFDFEHGFNDFTNQTKGNKYGR